MTVALLDGDIYAYRAAVSCQTTDREGSVTLTEPREVAIQRAIDAVERTKHSVGAKETILFFTGSENFRCKIDPNYKANRVDKPKPIWYKDTCDILRETYETKTVLGLEADDLMCIHHTEVGVQGEQCRTVLCSIDKDLNQIEGHHFNYVKEEMYYVGDYAAWYNFFHSMLVGDAADNIKGASGIGKVKAARILEQCASKEEMFSAVYSCFTEEEDFIKTYKLLWLCRSYDETYDFLKENLNRVQESI